MSDFLLPLRETQSTFPVPDWDVVSAQAEQVSDDAEAERFWMDHGREWVHLLRRSLGPAYLGYESRHFWLISSQPDATSRRIAAWLETTRTKVIKALGID